MAPTKKRVNKTLVKVLTVIVVLAVIIGLGMQGWYHWLDREAKEAQEAAVAPPDSLSATPTPADDSKEDVVGVMPEPEDPDVPLPYQELMKFRNKSQAEVTLMAYSSCRECDDREHLSVQTQAGRVVGDIPTPRRFNFGGDDSTELQEIIVYGECSDDVLIYHKFSSKGDDDEAQSGPTVSEDEYELWRVHIEPSGEGKGSASPLTAEEFAAIEKKQDFGGCEVLRATGTY